MTIDYEQYRPTCASSMRYPPGKSSLLTCSEKRTTEARAEGKAFPEAADYSTIVVSEESLGTPARALR